MFAIFECATAALSQRADVGLLEVGNGCFRLSGRLVAQSATAALSAGERAFEGNASVEIDLREVEAADSAGLAVLLEWVAWTKRRGIVLIYRSMPQQLIALATISEVDTLLPVAEPHAEAACCVQ